MEGHVVTDVRVLVELLRAAITSSVALAGSVTRPSLLQAQTIAVQFFGSL